MNLYYKNQFKYQTPHQTACSQCSKHVNNTITKESYVIDAISLLYIDLDAVWFIWLIPYCVYATLSVSIMETFFKEILTSCNQFVQGICRCLKTADNLSVISEENFREVTDG